MYLPPGVPGFRNEHVYPISPRARALAGRGRHMAVLYCLLTGGSPRAAQIIATADLARIGIDVRVHCMPGLEFYARILDPSEPWDMAVDGVRTRSDEHSLIVVRELRANSHVRRWRSRPPGVAGST